MYNNKINHRAPKCRIISCSYLPQEVKGPIIFTFYLAIFIFGYSDNYSEYCKWLGSGCVYTLHTAAYDKQALIESVMDLI